MEEKGEDGERGQKWPKVQLGNTSEGDKAD